MNAVNTRVGNTNAIIDIGAFLGRRTLVVGEVGSGKTRLTRQILESFWQAGLGGRVCVLDMAPAGIGPVGGKIGVPSGAGLLYLTAPIAAPRLTGRNPEEVMLLARRNAALIEELLTRTLPGERDILVVNDASLYLQAGSLQRFWTVVQAHATALINAYRGEHFKPAPFTKAERDHVDELGRRCDRVIFVSDQNYPHKHEEHEE